MCHLLWDMQALLTVIPDTSRHGFAQDCHSELAQGKRLPSKNEVIQSHCPASLNVGGPWAAQHLHILILIAPAQSEVTHLQDLGCGTFGNVWLGHNATFGKVAVKTVKVSTQYL